MKPFCVIIYLGEDMVDILFVCTGDTCRSTMASSIMKEKIEKMNLKALNCSSSGLFVTHEINMNENAKKALKVLGIKPYKHKATQLTENLIKSYTYVLTMTQEQAETIQNRFPQYKNVFSLKNFIGAENVLDPYGKGEELYIKVASYLDIVTDAIIKKLITNGEI